MKKVVLLALMMVVLSAARVGFAQTTVWNHQIIEGPSMVTVRANQWVADEVLKLTDGRLKIQIYPSMGLGFKPDQMLGAVGRGVLEGAEIWSAYLTGELPAADVMELPGLVPFDLELRKKIQDALFPYWDSMLKKKNVVLMGVVMTDPRIFWTKKVVRTVSDLKGLKIRSSGTTEDTVIRSLGAVPVSMPFGDIYQATDRGTIDGFGVSYSSVVTSKFFEVAKCGIQLEWTCSVGLVCANKQAFDALPNDTQTKLIKAWRNGTDWEFAQLAAEYADYKKQLIAQGVTLVSPTAEMVSAVKQAGESYTNIWLTKAGEAGQDMLKKVKEFVR